ncbi:transposase [Hymenobacter caeli]|uniref:transposase n=1 Tax=Hymenobacter caeli TaxID=2735894 RepID=UPI0015705356
MPDTRRRKHSLRLIINALLYWTKSGCQWRLSPRDFSAFPFVYYYLRRWRALGPTQPSPGALLPPARGPLAAAQPKRGRARRPIYQIQRAGRLGQGL